MAGELAAEWIRVPDGNGGLKKVWVRDSTARREIAQLQTDVSGLVIPDPSDASPQMDGTAAAGSSADYSRADHVHPSDTSKADAATTLAGYGITDAYTKTQVDGMIPSVPSAYTSNPEMDGTASSGSSTAWARGDHVHPHDSTKADVSSVPTKTSDLTNDSGFLTSAPVASVNGQTGAVSLTASDVGALPSSTTIPTKTSDLTNDSGFITASAVPAPSSTSPAMDGTAAAGSSTDYARADHVHPSDTNKADVSAIPTATSDLTNDSGFVTLASTIFGAPETLANGSDLDTLTTVGHYSANSGSAASSMVNCPTTANFSLFVILRTDTYVSQIIIAATTNLYYRYQTSTGWVAWRKISTTAV